MGKPFKNIGLRYKLRAGVQLTKNGHLGLQIRCGVTRVALGGFDSHTFPPIVKALLEKGLRRVVMAPSFLFKDFMSYTEIAETEMGVHMVTISTMPFPQSTRLLMLDRAHKIDFVSPPSRDPAIHGHSAGSS